MNENRLINEHHTILDALKHINSLKYDHLVLFVVNDKDQMVGTLTDGDVRRALIAGHALDEEIVKIIRPNYNALYSPDKNLVEHLRYQKSLNMKVVPVLDGDNHIIDIIDLSTYRTKLPIDAVLMAGGKGERLRPLTEHTPKPLLKVGDKAIIDYNVDRLIEFGVSHINVTVKYLAEQIEEHYAAPHRGVQVKTIKEKEFLGTIGGIKIIDEFYNDTVLVMNSDLFTNIDFEDYYLHFKNNNADMSAAAVPYSVNVPFGIFDLDGHNVKGILEKPTYSYFANAGIYLLKRDIVEEIPYGVFYNATDLMNKLISEGKSVVRYPITGFWQDIGSKEEYAKAQELVKHIDEL